MNQQDTIDRLEVNPYRIPTDHPEADGTLHWDSTNADLAYSYGIPFSTHTAPSIHAHLACAVPQIEHIEYFHDHVRIENMLFEGVLQPKNGSLQPDISSPELGLELKRQEAEKWRVAG